MSLEDAFILAVNQRLKHYYCPSTVNAFTRETEEMKYDVNEVLTTITGQNVQSGDYGWLSNDLKKLKHNVEKSIGNQ